VLGCGTHSDYGFVTLLIQDDVGGLHVKSLSGEWISATPKSGKIVVNFGDCLERITNGVFRATPHRVYLTNPERERFSTALFFDPRFDALLSPLEEYVTLEKPFKYDVITFGQHLENKYKQTYKITTNM